MVGYSSVSNNRTWSDLPTALGSHTAVVDAPGPKRPQNGLLTAAAQCGDASLMSYCVDVMVGTSVMLCYVQMIGTCNTLYVAQYNPSLWGSAWD